MFAFATAAALISLMGIAFAQQDTFDCPSDLSSGQYDSYTYFEVSGRCSDAGVADYCCVTFMRPSSPFPCLPAPVPFTANARDTLAAVVDEQIKKDGQDETSEISHFKASFPKGVSAMHNRNVGAVWGVALDEFRDKTGIKDSFIPSRAYLTARKSGDWEDTIMVDFHC
ncbi:hypothetical protein VFPFJ_01481 [Purpureocillium lilacinum]|uniref:Uncharacterized protein n=1 Tax=Purpureocillium lilacinum TaxID=33203 RepID=A0A179I0K4_PURLI|nr:hypothetical protein VFPFJ_01481 [Purpureocillium lilacinum]KAK4092847.1 hypothetical protein Purlil1_2772 [Purpureocillium lilacinum]OAQ95371.1 hypothetical protein VFPFJ_01481 [Purpureocillium lilacinum]PWI71422.1 hypothetical protein PCL_11516 [Purpureocillium lilacinum]GJN66420.1 hypothetical protein PLICBS_000438 [Purpureocillium lilacinum]GJN80361.1 hypothetical protein PLIIFM63780_003887 [Purpureocillium lilacinum]